MPPRIAVVGSTNIDLVTRVTRLPAPGETIPGLDFAVHHGGKGANQAIAAARLGAEVVMVSRVGDDAFATTALAAFAAAGVDTRHVLRTPGVSTGVAPIFVDAAGENAIVVVPGANARLTPADVDAAAGDLARCDAVLLQFEVPLDTVRHAIDVAHACGVAVVLNPAPAAELDRETLAKVAFLVPNRGELARLTGRPVASDDEVIAAARTLNDLGVATVIVTLGGDGALAVDRSGVTRVAPVRVTARDTTGAGDAFIGAFARVWAETRDLAASLADAALYAADSVTKPGAQASYASAETFARLKTEHCG